MAANARRSGIDRLCLLRVGEDGPDPSPRQVRVCNTETLAAVEAWPETYVGFCYLNPSHDPAFLRDEMAHLTGCGYRGVADTRAYPNVSVETSGSQPELVLE